MDSVAADSATWWPTDMVRRYCLELIKLLLTFITPVIDARIFTFGICPSIHSPYCVMGHFFNWLKPNGYHQSSQLPNKTFWRKRCQQGWESSSFVFSGILNPCKIRWFFFGMGPVLQAGFEKIWQVEKWRISYAHLKYVRWPKISVDLSSKWFVLRQGNPSTMISIQLL